MLNVPFHVDRCAYRDDGSGDKGWIVPQEDRAVLGHVALCHANVNKGHFLLPLIWYTSVVTLGFGTRLRCNRVYQIEEEMSSVSGEGVVSATVKRKTCVLTVTMSDGHSVRVDLQALIQEVGIADRIVDTRRRHLRTHLRNKKMSSFVDPPPPIVTSDDEPIVAPLDSPQDDEVQFVGHLTREDRDTEGRKHAIDLQ